MKKRISAVILMMIFVLVMGITVSAATVQMNKSSATIQTGDTLKLSVLVNGKEKAADGWGSSEKSVATVSSTGVVTGKSAGSTVITAMVDGSTVECIVSVVKKSTSKTTRYNVLVLDTSNSMRGTPLTRVKQAAKRFCKAVLNSSGDNYIAIVTFSGKAKVVCGFTDNISTLNKHIEKAKVSANTNINAALDTAGKLLENVPNGSKTMKNVVLCSDGLPQTGTKSSSGRYKSSDHKYYKYANAAYKTDVKLKNKDYFIYALGFFHNSTGKSLSFGKQLMKDLASKDKYYVVTDAKDVDDVFDDIADKITKTTISDTTLTLKVGETYQLTAYVNGAASKAKWKSSKKGVASVNSNGKVTAKKAGKTTVTATVNGKKVKCNVVVKSGTTIKLNKTKYTMYVGEKAILTASVKGSSGKVTWKSTKPGVATVTSGGVITAKKVGKTVIKATVNGVTAKCTVTVKKAVHPLYSMYFKFKATKFSRTYENMDEEGLRLVLNDEAVIEKCGAYMEKKNGYWYCTMAFKGRNVTSCTMSAYIGYKGKIVRDAMTYSGLNKFTMRKDSDGIWSKDGSFGSVYFNVVDNKGNIVANLYTGKQSENTKLFDDKEEMKEWLRK